MRKKLGLLRMEEPEDEILITELLQTMHNTGRGRGTCSPDSLLGTSIYTEQKYIACFLS
jgi:hypothetical protein